MHFGGTARRIEGESRSEVPPGEAISKKPHRNDDRMPRNFFPLPVAFFGLLLERVPESPSL